MSATEGLIGDVSDTARWIAAYRAIETTRTDALFRDRFAARLAGPRGIAIAVNAPGGRANGWGFVLRTKLIDDAICDAIADGCDRVLNLAAGLDTRPYRLQLPADLDWIEADLPALVEEKTTALADATPHCRLVRHAVDLTDATARTSFLDQALRGAAKAFVLTEGLLCYLHEGEVVGLSNALTRPEVAWWMLEYTTPGVLAVMNTRTNGLLDNAEFKFAPRNGIAFFEELGWTVASAEVLNIAARRIGRLPWHLAVESYLRKPRLRDPGDGLWTAVVCLVR